MSRTEVYNPFVAEILSYSQSLEDEQQQEEEERSSSSDEDSSDESSSGSEEEEEDDEPPRKRAKQDHPITPPSSPSTITPTTPSEKFYMDVFNLIEQGDEQSAKDLLKKVRSEVKSSHSTLIEYPTHYYKIDPKYVPLAVKCIQDHKPLHMMILCASNPRFNDQAYGDSDYSKISAWDVLSDITEKILPEAGLFENDSENDFEAYLYNFFMRGQPQQRMAGAFRAIRNLSLLEFDTLKKIITNLTTY